MSFICLRMVDLPDSPAPAMGVSDGCVQGWGVSLTKEKHLDFISLHELVSFQLIFDLLIPLFPLPLLSAHSATHLGGAFSGLPEVEGGWTMPCNLLILSASSSEKDDM